MSNYLDHSEIKKMITISEDLEKESYRTPIVHNHLNVNLLELRKLYNKTQTKYRKKLKDRWEYYTGKASPEVYKEKPFPLKIMKTDIHLYLDSDDELITLILELETIKNEISFLEDSLKSVSQRTYLIKSAIDYKKFLNGQ